MIANRDKYFQRDYDALHRFAAAFIPHAIEQLKKTEGIVYTHKIPWLAYRMADEMMQHAFKIEGRGE